MRKPRSDSIIEGLPQNQQDVLERWLCEENLSYKDAVKRFYDDFAQRLSEPLLSRFFQSVQQRRMLDRITASANKAGAVMKTFQANPENNYAALVNVIGHLAFEQSLKEQKDFSVETLSDLTGLVLSAHNLKLKESDLSLKRDKFQFDATKAALAKLPQLKAIQNNSRLSEDQKLDQARLELFGVAPK